MDEPGEAHARIYLVKKINDTKIDTHKALLAANAVMSYGTSTALGMHWHGITVLSDRDGYNSELDGRQRRTTIVVPQQVRA